MALSLAGMANAQTDKTNKLSIEQKADKQTERMKKSLNLTDAQFPLVRDANLKAIQERENLKIEVQNRKKAIQENHKNQLQGILTPEQMKKAEAMMKKKEKKMKRKHKDE